MMGQRQRHRALLATLVLLAPALPGATQDADLTVTAELAEPAEGDRIPLYLAVSVNGQPTNLVAEFALDPATGRMFSPRSELLEVGLQPGRDLGRMVDLQAMPGVRFSYDEGAQTIDIAAPHGVPQTEVVSAMPEADPADARAQLWRGAELQPGRGTPADRRRGQPVVGVGQPGRMDLCALRHAAVNRRAATRRRRCRGTGAA
ncbi:MAG: hypothetical protein ACT4OK_06205 [Gemmobacter sp.]